MLALVLVGALVAQAFGAPTNCAEFCDDQAVGSGYNSQSRSSYSGYAKSSSYNSGSRSANLETLDENAIGANGFNANVDRPGNWRDEKHYVTDDGHGQMSYRAGQTVTGNGYSKFAEHSYSYGTHESHPAQANSQILSTAEFNAELQNLRGRINSFMGSFHVSAGSLVNAETLEDFKNKASVINNQLTNVCNQVDSGSSMYEQMHRMQQDFIRNVERMQRQMESIIIQSSSSSSVSAVVQPYPTAPSYIQPAPTNPAPIQQIPEYVSPTPDTIVQEINENFHHVNEEITTFYKTYTGSLDIQQRANIIAQASDIIKKLTDLEAQSVVKEDLCSSITYQKTSFQTFYQNILDHLQSLDNRALLDEKEKINSQLQEESAKFADNKRLLEKQKADIERQIEIKNQQHNELIAKLREQAEAAKRQQEVLKKQQEELRIRQEQIRREEQQRVEELRRRSEEERLAKQEVERVQPVQTAGSVHVSGSSNFESTIKASSSYDSSIHGSSGASYVRPTQSQPIYNAPAHLDFIALTNKLQQDLYRVQNEISNFNTYKMRLTAANSESVKAEALRRADFLRQRITNLCETSDQYRNQEIHSSAEALKRRFEEMVRSFESQAANYASQSGFSASGGYSSHSSYGTSGSVASVQAPSITNIEYEHSKSTELELSRRPVSSQRYAQGSESGYNGQQVDCVEAYASQPCVEQQQLRRYRRQAGEYRSPNFDSRRQRSGYTQQHEPIFSDNSDYGKNDNSGRYASPSNPQLHVGPAFSVLSFGPASENPEIERRLEDFTQRIGRYGTSNDYQSPRSESQSRSSMQPENRDWDRRFVDSSRQRSNYGPNENLETFEMPRNQNSDVDHRPRGRRVRPQVRNLEIINPEDFEEQTTQPVISEESQILHDNQYISPMKFPPPVLTERMGEMDKVEDYPLEKSSSNEDNSQQSIPLVPFDNSEHEQFGQSSIDERRFENPQESGADDKNLTLEKSGFYDYPKQDKDVGSQESRQSESIPTDADSLDSQKSEEFIEEKYNPYDSPQHNIKVVENEENENVNQNNENLNQQNSNNYAEINSGEINLESDKTDLTQQTRQQVDFGSVTQQGRQQSSQSIPATSTFTHENVLQNLPDERNPELNQPNEYHREQVNENYNRENNEQSSNVQNSNDKNQPNEPSYNIIDIFNDNQPNQEENKNEIGSTQDKQLTSTVSPSEISTPRSVPRYTWRVEPSPTPDDKEKTSGNIKLVTDQPHSTSENYDAKSDFDIIHPHRGDLPGQSYPNINVPIVDEPKVIVTPVTTEKPVTTERPEIIRPPVITQNPVTTESPTTVKIITSNPRFDLDYNYKNHERINVYGKTYSPTLPKLKDDCEQNQKSKFLQSNQGYINQQKYQHNYKYSQQSNFYNQLNNKFQINQPIQNPLSQQNTYFQFNHQVKPTEFIHQPGESFKFKTHQATNLKLKLEQKTNFQNPKFTELRNNHFGFDSQNNFGQLNQKPFYGHFSEVYGQQPNYFFSGQSSQKQGHNFSSKYSTKEITPFTNWWSTIQPSSSLPLTQFGRE